jgi:AraC-like DNA-binding protein
MHQTATRQVVFDEKQRLLLDEDMGDLDDRISDQIRTDARHRLQHIPDERSVADRLAVPDSNGELWTFRVTTFKNYPALHDGAVLIYGMEPGFCDWRALRTTDLAADDELCRLIPAMNFMQEEFRRGPTLGEISRTVHLSPFHFHRRFTELLGITPKHFQLECQIFHAKLLLASQEISLAEIAKTCAFAHQSHFTSRFKQATGLTPTRWRKLALRIPEMARTHLGAHR